MSSSNALCFSGLSLVIVAMAPSISSRTCASGISSPRSRARPGRCRPPPWHFPWRPYDPPCGCPGNYRHGAPRRAGGRRTMTDEQRAARLPDPEYLPHRSVVERVAHGVAAREQAPVGSHADWRPGPGRVDPVAVLERQAGQRVPGLVPIRYGRMAQSAVRLLPRRRRHHGGRPLRHPEQRPPRPALRRRPPAQLRPLRDAGAHARVRPQRLRRDPARALRVGRQAPRRQRRDRRPRPRLRRRPARARPCSPRSAPTARPCSPSRCSATSTSGTPASRPPSSRPASTG